jgi:hypothetical protein
MLRRIFTIAAATAILAFGALPVSAAVQVPSSTHRISFPGLHGLSAWGTYEKIGSKVRVNVCAKDTVHGVFAAAAVTLASNASNSHHAELGAVAIGYPQTVCVSETLRYTAHLHVYTFIGGKDGRIAKKSKTKTIY